MNRRGFLASILKLGVASAVLPSALTYTRRWQKTAGSKILTPFWTEGTRQVFCTDAAYDSFVSQCFIIRPTPEELDAIFALPPHELSFDAEQRSSFLVQYP